MAACFKTDGPCSSLPVCTSFWEGGGGSPLTEEAAAAVDDLFGSTSERGVDADGGRRRRLRRCGLLQMGSLSSWILPFFKTDGPCSSLPVCTSFWEGGGGGGGGPHR